MKVELENVDKLIEKNGKAKSSLIPVLQDIQCEYNWLPPEVLEHVAAKLEIPLTDVYGVTTFYRSFSLEPRGKHIVTVCLGTACHVRGGQRIAETISRELKMNPGETREDMKFTFETVNCLGACALGPIVVVDGEYHGQMTKSKVTLLLREIGESERSDEDGENT